MSHEKKILMKESIASEGTQAKKHLFWGAGVLLLVFVLYIPALGNYLQGDDFEWLNSVYQAERHPGLFFEKINNFHRPLVKISYWLNYSLFGSRVSCFNVFTVLLHLANLWLLFLLLLRLSRQPFPSVITVLAYGVSARYSEVTLWAAGRPDSLLMFFVLGSLLFVTVHSNPVTGMCITKRGMLLFMAASAAASKESWVILPFLALAMLWLVLGLPFRKALGCTLPLFVMLGIYLAYFIAWPLLAGHAAFTAYGQADWSGMLEKASLLAYRYLGLDKFFNGANWQYALLLVVLASGLFFFVRRRNRMALFGLIWLGLGISVSLPIPYSPARYNYIPLMGFWILIVFLIATEVRILIQRWPDQRRVMTVILVLPLLFYLAHQMIMLHWEIGDYRLRGQLHKQVADMYERVKADIPVGRPLLFIDLGRRQAVHEIAAAVKGYDKVLFVRKKAIWEQVFLAPLANFLGNPGSAFLGEVRRDELPVVLANETTTLIFNDGGFFVRNNVDEKNKILEYFQRHGDLPYKVQVLRFHPQRGET